MREYRKHFKSAKYLRLKEEFEEKYKNCAEKYLRKNVDSLKETNPGQAYNIRKKLGAKPGEWDQSNSFTLPSHENLSVSNAAEKLQNIFQKLAENIPLSMWKPCQTGCPKN